MVGPTSCGGNAASRVNAALLGLDVSGSPLMERLGLCREERSPPKECEDCGARVGEGGPDPASEPAALEVSPSVPSCFDLSRCNSDLARADLERLWLEKHSGQFLTQRVAPGQHHNLLPFASSVRHIQGASR